MKVTCAANRARSGRPAPSALLTRVFLGGYRSGERNPMGAWHGMRIRHGHFMYIYILISLYSTLYIYIYLFISSYHWCSNWEKHQWMDHEDFPLPCLIVGSYGANGARSKCATKCDTSLQLLPQHVSINSVRWYANQVMYLCMSVSVCLHACM